MEFNEYWETSCDVCSITRYESLYVECRCSFNVCIDCTKKMKACLCKRKYIGEGYTMRIKCITLEKVRVHLGYWPWAN